MKKLILTLLACGLSVVSLSADVVPVGSGSYTTQHPGYDQAGRNAVPPSTLLVSGAAATRPVATNEWWSSKLTTAFPRNMFCYPLALQPVAEGLGLVQNKQQEAITADRPFVVGVRGLTCSEPTVSDWSDWTVTMTWRGSDGAAMHATTGHGMPMVYFTKESQQPVEVNWASWGSVVVEGNMAVITGSYMGASYAVYAPEGASWTVQGGLLVSDLGGRDYWTAAMLPPGTSDALALARRWRSHAFAFPADTRVDFSYDEASATVRAVYTVDVDAKEAGATFLMGLLPHHWDNLTGCDVTFTGEIYPTVRGELRMASGNSFATELTFHGVLPVLPAPGEGCDLAELRRLIDAVIADHGLQDWTDSYNDGQLLNRLTQTARVAHAIGYADGEKRLDDMIAKRLENWLTYTPGEVAFLFYYHKPWSTLIGYPAGHGQDSNINDHNFHWAYMIGAAAWLAESHPGWAAEWGPMIDLLIRDAASADRSDPMFPYLRAFSPWCGHSWANGTASLGLGNDQESGSEAMLFHTSLILWGEATGRKDIRDLGIAMYATEASALAQYWFDVDDRILPADYRWPIVSRVFTNGFDTENFWGGGIAGSYGIQLYPINAGSAYLVERPEWAKSFWQAIATDTGVLAHEKNDNIWYDTLWQFLAMIDPAEALALYNDYKEHPLKFGTSQALTYYWLHSLATSGRPDCSLTADYPLAMAFEDGTTITYTAWNPGAEPRTVTYSNGFSMTAPAGSVTTEHSPIDNPNGLPAASMAGRLVCHGSVIELSSPAEGDKLIVTDTAGRTMLARTAAQTMRIDISAWPRGIYIFRCGREVLKVVR